MAISFKTLFRQTMVSVISLYLLAFSTTAMSGERFSEQGSELYRRLVDDLVKNANCRSVQECGIRLQIFGEDGDRVNFNMYAQVDNSLCVKVVEFLLIKGLAITRGIPITLKVYSAPKAQYTGFKSLFSKDEAFLRLEVNK